MSRDRNWLRDTARFSRLLQHLRAGAQLFGEPAAPKAPHPSCTAAPRPRPAAPTCRCFTREEGCTRQRGDEVGAAGTRSRAQRAALPSCTPRCAPACAGPTARRLPAAAISLGRRAPGSRAARGECVRHAHELGRDDLLNRPGQAFCLATVPGRHGCPPQMASAASRPSSHRAGPMRTRPACNVVGAVLGADSKMQAQKWPKMHVPRRVFDEAHQVSSSRGPPHQ